MGIFSKAIEDADRQHDLVVEERNFLARQSHEDEADNAVLRARVAELKAHIEWFDPENGLIAQMTRQIAQERDRYREALEDIADQGGTFSNGKCPTAYCKGHRARVALAIQMTYTDNLTH